ncbi:MAG TPA: N-acetylmuramic acid 6-phosphate etherase [Candidatus Acidoferrum sp.]|nr:N-acetylmuramic acid 6-phosphate etherase [Candidatus Acidoferrum sp.]
MPSSAGRETKPERRSTEQRVTEHRNPASRNLDRFSTEQILQLMSREDRTVAVAVQRELRAIVKAADAILAALRSGGRLFYVGAGSSGRMAVLDAAEIAPTFGTSPELVQALIAGGRQAVTSAVEGAEDAVRNGKRDLRARRFSSKDIIVGIAASGTTPYVLGALKYARAQGATIIALTSNKRMPITQLADIVIAPEVGPEVVTGSTRLKAGTSQKLVLNMLSTTAMVRLGHVYENLMIDAVLTNQKLEERALRILAEASGKSVSDGRRALRLAEHDIRVALVMLKRGASAPAARKLLERAGGNLRAALGEA